MSDETRAVRERRDRAYWRLSHAVQQQFDRECAERVVGLATDPRAAQLLELLRTHASPAALEAVSHELWRAIEDPARDPDSYTVRMAIAAEHSAYAAALWRHPNLAQSDCMPTSANEAYKARYLEALARTDDADAAEAAQHVEIAWQCERAEQQLAERRG